MPVKHKLFVYGTLIKYTGDEECTHLLRNFSMYDYGKFPYIVRDKDDSACVYGNILEVTKKNLSDLDKYEGVDRGLYTREVVTAYGMYSGNPLECFVYVATDNIHPRKIVSGSWRDR